MVATASDTTGTAWTGAAASPAVPRLQFLTGLTTGGGTATAAVVSLGSQPYSATET